MRLCFFTSDKEHEHGFAAAVVEGARAHGIDAYSKPLTPTIQLEPIDVAAMVGVKSARLFHACRAAGILPLYFDKGYVRSRRSDSRAWEFWRVSVGAHHPTSTTLMRSKMPADRFDALGLEVRPWRGAGFQILFAGSSEKYHEFYRLPHPTVYARQIVAQLRKLGDRPIIYRPKPSWKGAEPIPKTHYSGPGDSLATALGNAHAVVTHGSNICFEAALAGIPTICLGDAVARPISSISLEEIDNPRLGKREQWLRNLAYHQFTIEEYRSGEAWATIGDWIRAMRQEGR